MRIDETDGGFFVIKEPPFLACLLLFLIFYGGLDYNGKQLPDLQGSSAGSMLQRDVLRKHERLVHHFYKGNRHQEGWRRRSRLQI